MKNLFFAIAESPYTYALIMSCAVFLAAFSSDQVIKQRKKTNKTLKNTKNIIITNLNKTIEAKNEIIGMFTGGDSYPEIMFGKNSFLLASNGKYGIPNLKLQIVHIKDYEKVPIETLSKYLNNQKASGSISVVYTKTFTKTFAGTMHTIKFSDIGIHLDKKISHGFDFNFNSDFKRWTERVRLINVNDKWEVLIGLEEETSHKKNTHTLSQPRTIYFRASPDFPYLEKVNGKTMGRNQLFYHLTKKRDDKLNYHILFNRIFDMTEGNRLISPLDINHFNTDK